MRRLPIILVTAVLGLSSFALQAGVGIADKHTAKSIPCEACHGPDKGNPTTPALETCVACHPLKALTEKTASVKPANPHFSPHYQDQLDCTLCHTGHIESDNYCNQCHKFDFKLP